MAVVPPSQWGLLTIRSQAPVFANRLSYTPARLVPLQTGQQDFYVGLTHVNVWAQMPGYFFDGEWTQLSLRGAYGIAKGLELGAELPIYGRSGGFLDGFIMRFHRAFGITQSRRDQFAANVLRVQTTHNAQARTYLTGRDAGTGMGNPIVSLRQTLGRSACPGAPTLILDAALKLPLGSMARQFATENFAGLVGLALQQRVGTRLDVLWGGGIIYSPGTQLVYGMELSWVQKYLFAGLGLALSPHWRIVLQYLNQDGIVERAVYRPLNATTHEFALGVQWAPRTALFWLFEFGIIENSIHDANTPDFGLHLGCRWQR